VIDFQAGLLLNAALLDWTACVLATAIHWLECLLLHCQHVFTLSIWR
jgi:hypothetical protein